MSIEYPGLFVGGFGLFVFLLWFAGLVLTVYIIILFIKLARRGIEALELYSHSKSLEIRERESAFARGETRQREEIRPDFYE